MVMRRRFLLAPILAAIVLTVPAALPAHATVRTKTATITGASGQAQYDPDARTSWFNGWIKDTRADGWCAEVWIDWTGSPSHHDAKTYQVCGYGNSGWGIRRTTTDVLVSSVRVAVCKWNSSAQRSCGATWPFDALNAGTYYWERVDTGASGHG
jgi:hypothetical protein